jgi:hypothetical protein
MSNPVTKIEHVAETVGKDVLRAAEDLFHVGDAVVKALATASKLTPAFKAELAILIADAEPLAARWHRPSQPAERTSR